ncbi:hypothetical protein FJ251_03965 [bacterium]|nr:hypothetical protein [bacterium]
MPTRPRALLLALTLALPATAAAAPAEAERSLEAITIEGLAKGPEVLFINAREPARVELALGWRLAAAAGLAAPERPWPRVLRAALVPSDPANAIPATVDPASEE